MMKNRFIGYIFISFLQVKQKLIDQVKVANIKHCDLDTNEASEFYTSNWI